MHPKRQKYKCVTCFSFIKVCIEIFFPIRCDTGQMWSDMISTPTVSNSWQPSLILITTTPPASQQTHLAVFAGRKKAGIVSVLLRWQFVQAGNCQLHVHGRRCRVVSPPQANGGFGSDRNDGTLWRLNWEEKEGKKQFLLGANVGQGKSRSGELKRNFY